MGGGREGRDVPSSESLYDERRYQSARADALGEVSPQPISSLPRQRTSSQSPCRLLPFGPLGSFCLRLLPRQLFRAACFLGMRVSLGLGLDVHMYECQMRGVSAVGRLRRLVEVEVRE